MAEWLIGIIVCSVVMSFILKLIPENSIKKSVHISFGIIFLLLTAIPLLNIFSNGIDLGSLNMLFENRIETLEDSSDDKYVESVISEYSESLNNVAENKILEEKNRVCDVSVTVCDDVDSSLFGEVLNVKCYVSEECSEDKPGDDKSIFSKVPIVSDIVISLDSKKSEDKTDHSEIYEVLNGLFGVSEEQCEIYLKGDW